MHYAYLAYQGNFVQFRSGGYLQRYPNQWGLFLLEYLMIRIFGGQNYLAFELFNAFAIVAIVYELSEIARINGSGRLVEVGVMLLGLLFLPLEFYAIYVYGNIFSMAFALAAVKNQMLFTRDLKIRNASLCAVEISLAVWLKSTIEIYLVAIVIYAVVDILVNRRNGFWKRVLFLVLVAAAFYLQSAGTRAVIQKMTGMELSNPISMVSWVAMGLQEAEAGPGWWNGYNRESYYASGNNTELQTQMALDNIRESVRVFCQSPGYALSFFTRKITSTWMNPTFQCFATVRNNVFIYLPEWVQNLLTYGGQYSISKYLNVLLFLIYTGSLADIVYLYIHREYTEIHLDHGFRWGRGVPLVLGDKSKVCTDVSCLPVPLCGRWIPPDNLYPSLSVAEDKGERKIIFSSITAKALRIPLRHNFSRRCSVSHRICAEVQ